MEHFYFKNIPSNTKVKHKKGTSKRKPPESSWKEYAIRRSNHSNNQQCAIQGCQNQIACGCHVICCNQDKREWILLICDDCYNQNHGETVITKETQLVRANKGAFGYK